MSNDSLKALKGIPMAEPNVVKSHPFKNKKNHDLLVTHIKERLMFGDQQRKQLTSRYEAIDKDVAAFMNLSDDDQKRRREQLEGKGPKGVAMHVPFVLLHLDDALTYFLNVFAPETGMFQALGNREKQPVANSLAQLMNHHADHRGYFRNILKFCFDAMKYNLAGIRTQWEIEMGNVITNDTANNPKVVRAEIWSGNDLKSLDMYNTIWDPSVHPIDLNLRGEFIAEISKITPFRLRKLAMDGAYYQVGQITEMREGNAETGESFYIAPPELWDGQTSDSSAGKTWTSILSQGTQDYTTLGDGIELWTTTIQLVPQAFGLKTGKNSLETWRITIANGKTIIAAVHLPNAHGRLPYNFASPMEDNLGFSQKSIAEILAPFQNLGSYLVNTHMASLRKNIWDLTVYDPSVIPLDQIAEGDTAGRIPVNPAGYGKDISKAIWQNSNLLDTKEAMNQLMKVIDLMQLLWPTSANVTQVANMDRAVEEQVTQTIQTSNRRLQKAAKLIDDQALKPMRSIMYSNIQEFQTEIDIIDPNGETVKVNPAQFRGLDFQHTIGQGLKTMDKQALIRQARSLLQMILQSQEATQQYDIPGLVDGLSDMMDIKLDLSQYRRAPVTPPTPPATSGEEG